MEKKLWFIFKRSYNKKNKNVIIDDKNIKEIEKKIMKLSNKFYSFEEKMKKNFIVKNKLNKNEFNKNEKLLLKYEKLNNEKNRIIWRNTKISRILR